MEYRLLGTAGRSTLLPATPHREEELSMTASVTALLLGRA
jgi:hypothetical protein